MSVIVPNYNHARFLRQRLDTILAQTYQDFELILLDDSSTDDSRTILREYAFHPRVTEVVFNDTNSGTTFKQWNKGVRLARGKYVWIAESDDYADARLLDCLAPLLDADKNVVIAYCRSRRIWEDGGIDGFADGSYPLWKPETLCADFSMDGYNFCREYLCGTNRIPNASAVLFRKRIFDSVGGADETLGRCGDWKLWAAMALLGRVTYIAEPLNHFRQRKLTIDGRSTRLAKGAPEVLSVSLWVRQRVGPLSPDRMKIVRSMLADAWVRPLISPTVPIDAKKKILSLLAVCDPHPVRSGVKFVGRRLMERVWQVLANVWYPALDLTFGLRHAIGLHRNGWTQLKARLGR